MTSTLVLVQHRTLPGQRDAVRAVWERHMPAAVGAHEGHLAYAYCLDDGDPDVVVAVQEYASAEAAAAFLTTNAYLAYAAEVAPLLAGPPQVRRLTPVWRKG